MESLPIKRQWQNPPPSNYTLVWVKNICCSRRTYKPQVEFTKKWTCLITLSENPFVLGMRQLGAAEDYPTRVQLLASLRDSPYQDLDKKNSKFNWLASCFWK